MTRNIGWAWLPAGVPGIVLLGAALAYADDPEVTPPPYRGDGDLAFFVDLAAFRAAPGRADQEVYVAVSNDQLTFESVPGADGADAEPADGRESGPLEGELLLEIRLRTEDGEEVASLESSLRPQAASRLDADDRGILQVIREKVAVSPGTYHLEVTVTDLRSQRVGLFNRMRKAKNRGRLESWIEVPAFDSTKLELSDLALVRSARAADGETAFGRNGVDFDPNPSRFYGLVLPSVKYYVEAYGGEQYVPGDSFLVLSQVRDTSGLPLAERRSRAVPQGGSFVVTDAVSLAEQVAAGHYLLSVELLNERTRETARVERTFDVMWSVTSWGQDPGRMFEEMALIMTDSEFDTLEKLSPGAREVYLSEFWHGLDPTPDTPQNEVLDRFRKRVRLADRNYPQTLRRGVLTDRGRVLVRYGIPDDVDYQYSSSGFGPSAGSQQVSEPGERADLSNRPSPSFLTAEEFREGDVSGLATQRGGATIKSKQLEVWSYDGRGSPLRPDHQDLSSVSHRGLKFVFADEMGNGEYQLVGSEGATVY